MSYWVYLIQDEECVKVPKHNEGGTYLVGGNERAELNITYNYSRYWYNLLDLHQGLEWLTGKKAGDTIEKLEKVVEVLGTNRHYDYWQPTPGNAGHAASILLSWARLHPDATWEVS